MKRNHATHENSHNQNKRKSQQEENENLIEQLDFFKINQKVAPKSSFKLHSTDNSSTDSKKERKKRRTEIEYQHHDEYAGCEEGSRNDGEIRKAYKIKVYGSDVPRPIQNFQELCTNFKMDQYLLKSIEKSKYANPTPIQMQAIPVILKERDLIACAPTGSGKTLAFTLPILHQLKAPEKIGFRSVIVTPTRELAIQIHREMTRLIVGRKFKVCVLSKRGNVNSENDMAQYKHFDILITTPLRLVHALKTNAIALNYVRHLVLDEADRLLDLGFLDQIDEILASCTNPKLQKSLFSATISSGVEELANSFMIDPVRVVIGAKNMVTETIEQELLFVGGEEGKVVAMRQIIQKGMKPPVLIFVQSIERAKELFHELIYDNINVDVIHSERTKAQRDNIVYNFRIGKIWVLITTELMARGVDFKGVQLVINYDFPQSVASYIHRIGRTGRAGMTGKAITFFTKDDAPYLKSIVNVMRESGCEVPEWMLSLKKPSKNMKKELKQKGIKRRQIKVVSKYDNQKMKHKKQIIQGTKEKKRENQEQP